MDPANDLVPSSPTQSSISSSDLDTESTGSFFHDRSTTLGTLMGVTLQAITFRASSSQHRQSENAVSVAQAGRKNKKPKKGRARAAMVTEEERLRRRRRRWWRLCRDDYDCRRASLGEYLEVERRFGDGVFLGGGGGAAAELEEGIVQEQTQNGRNLFSEGRVLPPAEIEEEASPAGGGLCRFSVVSLSGICSGGGDGGRAVG
ncbi:Uncharacterized protein Fot_47903 [Forsythia ovata]|uniref:Uncharacterized protein n=1 Tax=Forsythia ovata TaxID=205694 RepID=A0ABD1QSK5_9LAMI